MMVLTLFINMTEHLITKASVVISRMIPIELWIHTTLIQEFLD